MESKVSGSSLVSLSAAASDFLPQRNGKPVSASTLWRWTQKGIKGTDGSLIKLEVWHCGGATLTTQEACNRFIEEQTLARRSKDEPEWPRRDDATDQRLRDQGLL